MFLPRSSRPCRTHLISSVSFLTYSVMTLVLQPQVVGMAQPASLAPRSLGFLHLRFLPSLRLREVLLAAPVLVALPVMLPAVPRLRLLEAPCWPPWFLLSLTVLACARVRRPVGRRCGCGDVLAVARLQLALLVPLFQVAPPCRVTVTLLAWPAELHVSPLTLIVSEPAWVVSPAMLSLSLSIFRPLLWMSLALGVGPFVIPLRAGGFMDIPRWLLRLTNLPRVHLPEAESGGSAFHRVALSWRLSPPLDVMLGASHTLTPFAGRPKLVRSG